MTRTDFINYWKDHPGFDIKPFTDLRGYDWFEFDLENSVDKKYQAVGYEDVCVLAKFKGEDLIAISYSSHVAHSTQLEKEFWQVSGSK